MHACAMDGGTHIMVLQSLAGLPAFIVYFGIAAGFVVAYVIIYTTITRHDEFALIRANAARIPLINFCGSDASR